VALPTFEARDHAFDPAAIAGGETAEEATETGFLRDGSAGSLADGRRTRNVGVIRCASDVRRNS